MGYSNWSDSAYNTLKNKRKGSSRSKIFTNSSNIDPGMNPNGLTYRESRDSDVHPNSNAIVVAFDITGSMGSIPEQFAREKLGGLMRMLVERDYIDDPQVLFAGVGDATCDRAPLQIGQFESGLEMDMWLTRIWIEGGGGGQMSESYGLAHLFAARYTRADCFEKRGKKGYLFTMGDEMSWGVPAAHVQQVFGHNPEADLSMEELVALAQERYEVFHIVVSQGYHGGNPKVLAHWRELLGERALVLDEVDGVCELIATTIGLCEGRVDLGAAAADMRTLGVTGSTVDAVSKALAPLSKRHAPRGSVSGALPSTGGANRLTRL